MIVDDKEAARFGCPLHFDREGFVPCVGKACMAWRPVKTPGGSNTGYCGMAGSPAGVVASTIMHAMQGPSEPSLLVPH